MAYTLVPTELIVDGAITSAKLDTNISISGTLGVTGELTLATHMIMGDNDKIKIGTGGDLEIYHDGSNSYISNSTGNIYLGDTNGSVHIQAKLNEESIICAADGAVTLYHDNSPKLATSSAGVTVTGTLTSGAITSSGLITATSLDISGDIDVDGTTNLDVVDIDGAVDMASTLAVGGAATIGTAAASTNIELTLNGVASKAQRIKFQESGVDKWLLGQGAASETSAFELYNSGGLIALSVDRTTNVSTFAAGAVFNEGSYDSDFRVESNDHEYKFFVDAGNNKIGIATSSPAADVHIKQIGDISNGNSQGLMLESGVGSQKYILQTGRAGVSNAHFTLRDVTNTRDIFSVIDTDGKFQGHTSLEWNNGAVFNENSQDHDFRVESNDNEYMLFVDASANRVGVGIIPTETLHVNGRSRIQNLYLGEISSNFDIVQATSSAGLYLVGGSSDITLGTTGFIFNEGGADKDFRVEGDTAQYALFVDASNDVTSVGSSGTMNAAFADKTRIGFNIDLAGIDDHGGHMFMTQLAAEDAWMDICQCHDANATGVLFFIHGVRTVDQNRSYGAMVRYAYNNAFNIMSSNSQNATVEYRVSNDMLQYRFTTAGPYIVNLTVMAAG